MPNSVLRAAAGLILATIFFSTVADATTDAVEVKVAAEIRQVRVEVFETELEKWLPIGSALHNGARAGWLKVALSAQIAGRQIRVMASEKPSIFADKMVSAIAPQSIVSSNPGWNSTASAGMNPDARIDAESAPPSEADIELADIWAWQGDLLYFFNQYRGLQVIDMADMAAPRLIAQYRFPAQGEDLYALADGRIILIGSGMSWAQESSSLLILRHTGESIVVEDQIELGSGDYVDSRRYGDFLYVLTRDWITDEGNARRFPRVQLHTIDLAAPAGTVPDAALQFTSDGYYDAVLDAQPGAILIALSGRNQAISPSWRSMVYVLEPGQDGKPRLLGTAEAAGVIRDKFKMRYHNGVLTTISQQVDFANFTFARLTRLENFQLLDDGFARMGHVELAPGESVFGTRFHHDTVFVVTFLMVDPLFAIDNRDPRRPRVVGELKIPGWSNYLEVVDGWLFAIGPEDGRLAVSQFDFSDLENLQMVSRVYLSESAGSYSEAEFNEQAIAFFPQSGLMLLPFSHWDWQNNTRQQALQLINWNSGGLTLRGNIAHQDQARRGSLHDSAIISISGRELRTTDISDPDLPVEHGQLTLAWDSRFVFKSGDFLLHLDPGEDALPIYGINPFEDGSGNSVPAIEPVLHVTDAAQPNSSLRELTLLPGRLLGATVHGNRLWTLQEILPEVTAESRWQLPQKQELVVRMWDISSLEELRLINEATHLSETYLAARFDAKVLNDGSVLWLSQGGGGFGWWRGGWEVGIPGFGWWHPQQRAMIVASLTAEPESVRITHVESVSYESDYAELSDWHWLAPLLLASSSEFQSERDETGRFHYRSTNRLHGWDLSNPNQPVKLPIAHLPSRLHGALAIDAENALLFFEPENGTVSVWGWDRINALELVTQALPQADTDGTAYSWSQFWMPPFHGRNCYHFGSDDSAHRTLEVWRYGFGDNRFTRAATHPIDTWIQQSAVHEPHVLVSTSKDVTLFTGDATVGIWQRMDSHTMPTHLSWQADLSRAVISPEALWLPMGLYGVESIQRTPAVLPASRRLPHASLPAIPRATATWQQIPQSDWRLTQTTASGKVGKLVDARWLFRPEVWTELDPAAADLGDDWRQSQWFGQYRALADFPQAIAHTEHGHIAFFPHGDPLQDGTVIYDAVLSFIWTSPNFYPWVYRFETESWLYYAVGSGQIGQRWFYLPSVGWRLSD